MVNSPAFQEAVEEASCSAFTSISSQFCQSPRRLDELTGGDGEQNKQATRLGFGYLAEQWARKHVRIIITVS
ncbi:unnamed protein product [Nippostrongylus brasiliensis]|uniref:Uncharacterized protein n=1 Tax=Nippostrongylus brasiliensis TaxID=27835 RepID=A0A0N4YXN7_NIPBR|nr:unnamed protein product [Nippostrongylus brasiliensis]